MRLTFAAVILGAGRSRRMGSPKLLMPWPEREGGTVVGGVVRVWRRLGAAQVGVVCREGDSELARELDRIEVGDRILNPEPDAGMFGSVRLAASWGGWGESISHFAIALGDQPHLRIETLQRLLGCAAEAPEKIWVPSQGGRSGHPVLLPRREFLGLGQRTGGTLRDFLAENRGNVAECAVDDPGLLLDIDRPEDYEAARKLYEGYHSITTVGQTGKRPHSAP